jgi:maltose alpha-D-glucosyltransferase/alpha-amylase
LAALLELVPNEGDAWSLTRDALRDFFERALASGPPPSPARLTPEAILSAADGETPDEVQDLIGTYLESARLLGQRTAELHAALGSITDASFVPEPHSPYYQRALYQSLRNQAAESFRLLRRRSIEEGLELPAEAISVLERESDVLAAFRQVVGSVIRSPRIRTHGDYHLGQVLYTGRDFVIIDFEGEPARPIAERRVKRTPLRDVAGMLRSFSYAVQDVRIAESTAGLAERADDFDAWGRLWNLWVCATFVRAYLQTPTVKPLLPATREELLLLLRVSLLEKAVYEISYELNNRPDWLEIPLRGILELLEAPS